MPAYFNKATGKRVTADEATHDGKRLRDGYNWMLEEGESARFSIGMLDAGPRARNSVFLTDVTGDAKKDASSIDEALRNTIEQAAKANNMKPSEWLASRSPHDVEKMIVGVAQQYVAAAGAAGVASTFNMDAAANILRAKVAHDQRIAQIDAETSLKVAEMRAAHNRKFGFMGDSAPPFDEATAAIVARSKIATDSASVVSSIRDAQYQ
jgi:hypothetical protein